MRVSTTETKPKSMWCIDKKFEETSVEFLRKKTNILKELGTKEIVKDRDRQLKGIDLVCDIPRIFPKSFFKKKDRNVDIKSIAKVIPTFSFEISGNASSKQVGWLCNDALATDYYLIVYHQIEDESMSYKINKQKMTIDNIIYTKALLIKKEKLINLLKEELHEVSIEKIVEDIRNQSEDKKGIRRYIIDNSGKLKEKGSEDTKFYFTVSNQLREKPVNVIIKRQFLEKIAEHVWEVDGDGCPYLA